MTRRGRFAISPVGAACWVAAVVAYAMVLLTGDGWLLAVVAVGVALPFVDLAFACAAGDLALERSTRAVARERTEVLLTRVGRPRVEGALVATLLVPGGSVSATICAGCSAKRIGYVVADRGALPVVTWIADAYGPLGLAARRRHRTDTTPGLVVPRRVVPQQRPLGGDPHGTSVVSPAHGGTGDPAGVREHRPGDARARVHWRSTARRGEPVVREWATETGAGLVVAVGRFGEDELPDVAWWAAEVAGRGLPVTVVTATAEHRPRTPDDVLDLFALLQPGSPPRQVPAGPVRWLPARVAP